MKRITIGLLIGIFFLTACGGETPQAPPIAVSAIETSTPTPLPTATRTPIPSVTPTASITPLPTIPTFTPTFDVSTIVTATPAPKAECPVENTSLIPNFRIPTMPGCSDNDSCFFAGSEMEISNFLNQGGSVNSVISRLRKAKFGNYQNYVYKDITGDSIPEFMFVDFEIIPSLHILYCDNRKYADFTLGLDTLGIINEFIEFGSLVDLNSNGLPETIIVTRGCSGSGCFSISVLEWNGDGFTNLSPQIEIDGLNGLKIKDTDNNGTKEILLKGGEPGTGGYAFMVPWRYKTYTYIWNGHEYTLAGEEFEAPQFRFQALQDADNNALKKKYDKALLKYQDVIFSDKLDWWSLEKRIYYINDLNPWGINLTPGPLPDIDPTEYPRLAAYAYYRIMLLHIVQNHESDAGTVYKTLQQKFGNNPYGSPYVEMATSFWDAYQSTHKMYDGCAAAIQYTVEHPEILTTLGSDYHGTQSHIYVPEDVCPFR